MKAYTKYVQHSIDQVCNGGNSISVRCLTQLPRIEYKVGDTPRWMFQWRNVLLLVIRLVNEWSTQTVLNKTRQDKARQGKTRQDKTRQDKARQGKTRQDKARQDKTRQDKTYIYIYIWNSIVYLLSALSHITLPPWISYLLVKFTASYSIHSNRLETS